MMANSVTSRKLNLVVLGIVIVIGLVALTRLYTDNPPSTSISVNSYKETRGENPKLSPYNTNTHAITHSDDEADTYDGTGMENAKQALSSFPNTVSKDQPHANQPSHKLQVVYRDLSICEKPQYLPEYQSHCWGRCKAGQTCSQPPTHKDIEAGRAKLICFEDFYIIGVRKCGSTDLSRWFLRLDHIYANKFGRAGNCGAEDYYPNDKCPAEYFAATFPDRTTISTEDRIYHYGPGTLLASKTYHENSTHMIVSPTSQVLGFMATPKSRFHIQLRHPTDRAISYLFHWHRGGLIFKEVSHEKFSDDFTNTVLLDLLKEMKECITELGELGCLYQTNGIDGVLPSLLKHSLYVVYIEEAFKFIPQDQFVFTTMEEYSQNETRVMKTVMDAFGIEFHVDPYLTKQAGNVMNKGKKNPIADHVIKALDDFFMPYNQRLAKLLTDDRFLYLRT